MLWTLDYIQSEYIQFECFVIEYIAMSLFFDYWGDHAAGHAPAPFNDVSTYLILPHIKFIVSKLNILNFTC